MPRVFFCKLSSSPNRNKRIPARGGDNRGCAERKGINAELKYPKARAAKGLRSVSVCFQMYPSCHVEFLIKAERVIMRL